MRVAIIGRNEALYDTVLLLLEKKFNIPLIITSKEAPEYTKTSKDFEELAHAINAKFIFTNKINDIKDEILKCGKIDIAISVNYVNMISQSIIDIFPLGILNAHGGDLPKYRGNACQAWAILNGEEKIGLCIHKMQGDSLDSGDIIARDFFKININTKVSECISWIYGKIPSMFYESLKKLSNNKNFILEKQSKNPRDILRCYPRIPEDGKINWHKSNFEIIRLINATNKPYSGAYGFYNKKKLIIWDAEIYDDNEQLLSEVGQISMLNSDGSIIVITGSGKIKINTIEYDGFVGKPKEKIKSIRIRIV